jgi:hypothetical protein
MIGGAEILRCPQDDRLGGGEEFQIQNFRFEIRRKAHDEEGIVVATRAEARSKEEAAST